PGARVEGDFTEASGAGRLYEDGWARGCLVPGRTRFCLSAVHRWVARPESSTGGRRAPRPSKTPGVPPKKERLVHKRFLDSAPGVRQALPGEKHRQEHADPCVRLPRAVTSGISMRIQDRRALTGRAAR